MMGVNMDNENFEQDTNNVQIEKPPIEFKPKKDWKKLVKDIIYYACIAALICIIIYMYIGSRPIKGEDFSCVYKEKQDKIVCTQTGDVVPKWLDVDLNNKDGLFGGDNYSMLLIFSKDDKDYVSLKMKDGVFVEGMNRKFIYEAEEQSLSDYIRFKNYVKTGNMSNWGSSILYCSDKNVQSNDVCKEAKRRHR